MIALIIVVVIGMLVAFYLLKCITVIGPKEFGVKVTMGKPEGKVTSGWYFVFWPFQKVVKMTKELMMFQFIVESAVTGRGKIDGYNEIVEPVEVDVECTVYAQFDEKEAEHIVQYAPGYDAQALGPFLVPYSTDTVRSLAGRLPWRLINRERYKSATWVQARLTGGSYYGINDDDRTKEINFKAADNDPAKKTTINAGDLEGKSPFVTLHLKNVSFVIENLTFPEKVRDSIVAPEKAQLDGKAMIITAEASKTKKIKEGEGDANARGKMLAAIKKSPELEAISALKEIGKGPSNFIFSLPKVLDDILAKIGATGGKS